jgi:membrane-associated protease RseP (regulator of RpoE activity)
VLLFLLTAASAVAAGLQLEDGPDLPNGSIWGQLPRALAFSAALLSILLAHEFGHFFAARQHGVDASWPYFLPAPLLSFVGTFGAVIRLRELPRTRRALLDIGAVGPLAGFFVAAAVLWLGLNLSTVSDQEQAVVRWTLFDALDHAVTRGEWPELRNAIELGDPPLLLAMQYLRFGPLGPSQSLVLHPIGLAGWFGLLVTSLNLLPLGQLDGGHILHAVSPRLHRLLGPPFSALLLGLGIFTPFLGWALWGLATGTVLSEHPPVSEPEERLGWTHRLLALGCLGAFLLSFTSMPLALLRK